MRESLDHYHPDASMNDYWNDPPEYPDPPECCGEEMEIHDDGTATCAKCGETVEPFPDPEDEDIEMMMAEPEHDPSEYCEQCDNIAKYSRLCERCARSAKCAHGNPVGQCDHCDYLGDIAFDSAREARHFRR